MPYSEAQKKATMGWEKRNYEQIRFTAPKGFKEKLKDASQRCGYKSMRAFILATLEKEMNK